MLMQNLEMALLTQVILTQNFGALEKMHIDESYFTTELTRQVYAYLRSIYFGPDSRGATPDYQMVLARFPTFYLFNTQTDLRVIGAELKQARIRMELLQLSEEIGNEASSDPLAALAKLRARAGALAALSTGGADLSIAASWQQLRSDYDAIEASGGMAGIPYPWQVLNEETQGMQNGQFIVLYGRPKSMKTWVGISIAEHAYMCSRKRVLFYTREMSVEQIAKRVAARIAKVDYKKFLTGRLQPDLKEQIFELFRDLERAEIDAAAYGQEQPVFQIVSDRNAGSAAGGITWLRSKIDEFEPDAVFVDGMYLMKDDRSNQRSIDWKQIAHVSQDLKLTAQEYNIPLLGITQANRGSQKTRGDDLTELAFSDSLGQDADAVFRVIKKDVVDPNTQIKRTELHIKAPGLREGTLDGFVLEAHPATHFEYLRTITPEEEERHEQANNGRSGGGGGGGAPSGAPAARSSFSHRQQREPNPGVIRPR
jgi:replicative DNA helicase